MITVGLPATRMVEGKNLNLRWLGSSATTFIPCLHVSRFDLINAKSATRMIFCARAMALRELGRSRREVMELALVKAESILLIIERCNAELGHTMFVVYQRIVRRPPITNARLLVPKAQATKPTLEPMTGLAEPDLLDVLAELRALPPDEEATAELVAAAAPLATRFLLVSQLGTVPTVGV